MVHNNVCYYYTPACAHIKREREREFTTAMNDNNSQAIDINLLQFHRSEACEI